MAISVDMSYWIDTIISQRLIDICPSLNLGGEDRKVYDICRQDFRNYLRWFETYQLKIDNQEITLDGVTLNLRDTEEAVEFIKCFISMWWGKWVIRTKIVLNADDLPKKMQWSPINATFPPNLTVEEHKELSMAVIDKLIQCGEICCTQVLAGVLLKKALEDNRSSTIQDKVQLIPKLRRTAKEISYTHGALIFIKPDSYFKVREFRDDNHANSTI